HRSAADPAATRGRRALRRSLRPRRPRQGGLHRAGHPAASGAVLPRRARAGDHRLRLAARRTHQRGLEPVPTRRQLLLTAAATGLAGVGALSGCSRGAPAELEGGDRLRMRVWSEAAGAAYEESLAAFTADSGIEVELEVLSWDDYWSQLPLDVAGGTLPDVLWMNTAHLAETQAAEVLLDVGEIVRGDSSAWEQVATDLHRIDETLWGVPQYYDQSLLIANQGLVAAAGGDASALVFDPGAGSDPLRELATALTADGEGRHPGDEGFDPA